MCVSVVVCGMYVCLCDDIKVMIFVNVDKVSAFMLFTKSDLNCYAL